MLPLRLHVVTFSVSAVSWTFFSISTVRGDESGAGTAEAAGAAVVAVAIATTAAATIGVGTAKADIAAADVAGATAGDGGWIEEACKRRISVRRARAGWQERSRSEEVMRRRVSMRARAQLDGSKSVRGVAQHWQWEA